MCVCCVCVCVCVRSCVCLCVCVYVFVLIYSNQYENEQGYRHKRIASYIVKEFLKTVYMEVSSPLRHHQEHMFH